MDDADDTEEEETTPNKTNKRRRRTYAIDFHDDDVECVRMNKLLLLLTDFLPFGLCFGL